MTTPYLYTAQTKLLLQVKADLDMDEGFREYAYPDPLSPLMKKYPFSKERRWGFVPAKEILANISEKLSGAPWTVGYGFTQGVTVDSKMSKPIAERKLEVMILEMDQELGSVLSWYQEASFVTKTVLINMLHNLGLKGLLGFKNTLKYMGEKAYKNAAANMRKSLWAKQVGRRAAYLSERIETQTIKPEHKAPEKLC